MIYDFIWSLVAMIKRLAFFSKRFSNHFLDCGSSDKHHSSAKFPSTKSSKFSIASRQDGFIVPYIWEILRKISQYLKVATFISFIYLFNLVFRERISTRIYAFSILLNWEQHHLLYITLTVYTLIKVKW